MIVASPTPSSDGTLDFILVDAPIEPEEPPLPPLTRARARSQSITFPELNELIAQSPLPGAQRRRRPRRPWQQSQVWDRPDSQYRDPSPSPSIVSTASDSGSNFADDEDLHVAYQCIPDEGDNESVFSGEDEAEDVAPGASKSTDSTASIHPAPSI